MNINTSDMKANELAFAIAALIGHADISSLRNALVALIGKHEAYVAIKASLTIIDANQL